MALSIWVPLGYIGVLVVSLSLFSSVYRKRSAKNLAKGSSEPWFPEGHPDRDLYQSLVAAAAEGQKIPDEILKGALLARAMTDVKRIMQMRDDKQALQVLLQKGSIGDETTARFALAEKELEAEILDVVGEANTFREGWGQIIFPTASEMVTHVKQKEVYHNIPNERKRQIEILTKMGLSVPKPTITLPPLFTPPGTSVTIQQPPPQQPQPGQLPPQLAAQLAQAQAAAAAQAQAQAQAQKQPLGPAKPPTAEAQADGEASKTSKAATVEETDGNEAQRLHPHAIRPVGQPVEWTVMKVPPHMLGAPSPGSNNVASMGDEQAHASTSRLDDDAVDDGDEATAALAQPSSSRGAINRAQRRRGKQQQKGRGTGL